jgi:uncharacterized protein YndB with AHSA1/START domain
MAHNEIHIAAGPDAVFDVLADPRSYARWVVGSKQIRAADPEWPAAGATFDHSVGVGPLALDDATTVRGADRPRRLELLVRARPFTKAVVTLQLRDDEGGTRVEMDEHPADRRSRLLFFNPFTEPLIRLRNKESLRRLKALAEGAEPIPTGILPARESPEEAAVKGSSKPAAQ